MKVGKLAAESFLRKEQQMQGTWAGNELVRSEEGEQEDDCDSRW